MSRPLIFTANQQDEACLVPTPLFTHNDPLMRSIEGIIKYLPLSAPPNPLSQKQERGSRTFQNEFESYTVQRRFKGELKLSKTEVTYAYINYTDFIGKTMRTPVLSLLIGG